MRNLLILTLAILSIATLAHGQAFATAAGPADSTHSFWKSNRVWILSDGAAKATDAYFTHRALEGQYVPAHCYTNEFGGESCTVGYWKTAREVDPLARPFVGSTAGQVAYFAGTWAADTGLAYLFHRTGHHQLEKITFGAGIANSTYGAVTSARVSFTF